MIPAELVWQMVAFVGVYIVVTLALNIKAGHTGIPDFGHAMFFAMGGIVVGNLAAHLAAVFAAKAIPPSEYPPDVKEALAKKGVDLVGGVLAENIKVMTFINDAYLAHHPGVSIALLLFAIVVAMVLGGLLGWIASLPALRLRGEYLAILLLTTSEGLRIFMTYTKQVMGDTPTVGLTVPALFRWTGHERAAAAIFTIVVAVLVYIYMELIHNSPSGRLFRAVRDEEDAAKALGKSVVTVRRDAMIVGSALAALAGVLYSINTLNLGGSAVAATSIFNRLLWTFWPWALMILGGMASNKGIAIATTIVGVTIIGPIRFYKNDLARLLHVQQLGLDVNYFANGLEYLLIGVLIIVVLAVKPQGIIPEPPSRTLPRERIEQALAKARGSA